MNQPHSPPSADSRESPLEANDPLKVLIQKAGIVGHWDAIIVGDGSGNAVDTASGWCGILIDNLTKQRRVTYGAINAGSINMAELMPYLTLLDWYDNHVVRHRYEHGRRPVVRVHIVTDSQTVSNWGNKASNGAEGSIARNCGTFLAGIRHMASLGFVINFHWVARSSRAERTTNSLCDLIAGLARVAMISVPSYVSHNNASVGQLAAAALDSLDFTWPGGSPVDFYEV